LDPKEVIERVAVVWSSGGSGANWIWDETKNKSKFELQNKGKTVKFTASNGWFAVWGNKPIPVKKSGKCGWRLKIDKYTAGDKSGIVWGIADYDHQA